MNIEYVCPWEVEVKWHKPDGVTRVIHASGKTREDAFDQVRLIMDTPSISFDEAARRARWKPNPEAQRSPASGDKLPPLVGRSEET